MNFVIFCLCIFIFFFPLPFVRSFSCPRAKSDMLVVNGQDTTIGAEHSVVTLLMRNRKFYSNAENAGLMMIMAYCATFACFFVVILSSFELLCFYVLIYHLFI